MTRKMKRTLLAFAIVAFVATGAAQPDMAQTQPTQDDTDREIPQQPDRPMDDVEKQDLENNSDIDTENRSDIEVEDNSSERPERAESAQFDARLKVAIDTVSTLVKIAPDNESREGLQNALETLEEVQDSTDTASLGPEERPEEGNQSEEKTWNTTEEVENTTEEDVEEEEQNSSNSRPSSNSNRPGFVSKMIGGIF